MILSFVQNMFAPRANPIGVDFGSETLRLAQVQYTGSEHKLIAAASADVPSHVRHDLPGRLRWFVETTRDLLAQGKFRGREAVIGLPAATMHIQHLRMAKLDDEATKKALPWEVRGKLPIDPSQAILRHLIAGELFNDTEPKNEVIVMAAQREFVDQLLKAAAKARLDIVGMNIEPSATVDCFMHVYRRKTDADVTNCFIDIGAAGTRVTVARGAHLQFCRSIPIGGDHFARAVAEQLKISMEEARMMRIRQAYNQPLLDDPRTKRELEDQRSPEDDSFALLPKTAIAETTASPTEPQRSTAEQLEAAMVQPLRSLVEELTLCRRYFESTFPNRHIERLVFVGGESRQRATCLRIAREMQLAAQIGDPMVRMSKNSEIGMESGIDRRQAQPGWAVAIGLSMGPANVPALTEVRA
jgi:type IV pilus assembly protein PilM